MVIQGVGNAQQANTPPVDEACIGDHCVSVETVADAAFIDVPKAVLIDAPVAVAISELRFSSYALDMLKTFVGTPFGCKSNEPESRGPVSANPTDNECSVGNLSAYDTCFHRDPPTFFVPGTCDCAHESGAEMCFNMEPLGTHVFVFNNISRMPECAAYQLTVTPEEMSQQLSQMPDPERNPRFRSQIEAKIRLLQNEDLPEKIERESLFVVDFVTSTDGRNVPIVAVFPDDAMRMEAIDAVRQIKSALPHLENFLDVFPYNKIRIWYGFIMGNLGSGGTITTEDRGTYESTPVLLPFEDIMYHELAHSYIGSEPLTHFLDTYVFNLVHSNSVQFEDWDYMCSNDNDTWKGQRAGCVALLKIYHLIGRDRMSNAYKIIYQYRPPYGEPLSQECINAFVDQAPESLKSQVLTLASHID